jgi:hypothetical protein
MASRFWVGGDGTWDAADTTHWAATTGGAGGQSVPTSADTATFDASSGAGSGIGGGALVTVNANVVASSLTMGAFTGTLDFATNDNSPTFGSVAITGTATRRLDMGNGTWTVNGATGTVWSNATITNLTLNCNSSSIVFNGTITGSRGVQLGAVTYNNVTITSGTTNGFIVDLTSGGAFTIGGTLTVSNVGGLRLSLSTTHTITGAFSFAGETNRPAIILTNGTAATLSVGAANTWDWVTAQNITKSGAGSITINNGYSAGGNTSLTINNPSSGGVVGVIGG